MLAEKSLEELFRLTGKIAIVTGGAGYLGSEMCYALAEAGATVIAASRDVDKCQRLADRINNDVGAERAVGMELDVLNTASVQHCFEEIENRFNGLDILVNNAWAGKKNWLETIREEEWEYDVDIGLNSVFRCIRIALPMLKESDGAVIVNIASMYGHISPDWRIYEDSSFANPPSYGAAKAGVIQFTKYLACYLARHSIRVNAISPGAFPNPETQKYTDFVERLASKNPMNRIGEPWELKGAIVFLSSEASSYITGQNLPVDGGWTIW